MKESSSFLAIATGIVVAGTLAGWLLVADARAAVVAGGLLVLATQIPLHILLRPWRERNDRFMAAIVVGFGVRVAVLIAAVILFVVPGRVAAAPFLITLGGLMVAVLIAEATIESRRIRAAVSDSEVAAS